MIIENLSYEAFQNIMARIPDNNCSFIQGKDGLKIIDAGVEAAGGWSSAKKLMEGLICGLGQVNIGEILLKDFRLPTVELLLDDPARTYRESFCGRESMEGMPIYGPRAQSDCYNYILGFAVTDKITEEMSACGNLVLAGPASLASAVFNAGLPVMQAVGALLEAGITGENILWAWSSCPVATLTDNREQMMKRKETAREKGAIISVWLRGGSDVIQEVTAGWKTGQLRIHEMVTGKTYIGGCINEEELESALL